MRPRFRRFLRLLSVLAIVLACCASAGVAEAAWPEIDLSNGGNDIQKLERGPGFYFSLLKLGAIIALFLAWVATADWVSRDCQRFNFNFVVWNSVMVFGPAAALLLALEIPVFGAGFGLAAATYMIISVSYVVVRNKNVENHQRVLTPEHLRYVFASAANKVGLKVSTERLADYEKGAPVDLAAMGASDSVTNNANLLAARNSPSFLDVKTLIADVVERRGEAVLLDYGNESAAVRYQIDGVWHNREAKERAPADGMLAVMKTLSALNAEERRQKQVGHFSAKFNGHSYLCDLTSQGTKSGERVILRLLGGDHGLHTLTDLGMRDKTRDELAEIMVAERGMIVFSSPPGSGLTTLTNVALEETDRLMRNFAAVEEVSHRELEIQNVDVTTFDAAAGETPMTVLPKLVRTYPEVMVVRDPFNTETLTLLCQQVTGNDRLIVTTVRAKDAAESLLRMMMYKVPGSTFAPAALAAVNVRLVRKLCPECKVGYEPTADTLKKLGIPAGRVKALYRVPNAEEVDKPCQECEGIGYLGRTGMFELLTVSDKVREVLIKQPKLDLVRKASRLTGMRTLQEEGIVLVAKGITSLQELMRVLKQ